MEVTWNALLERRFPRHRPSLPDLERVAADSNLMLGYRGGGTSAFEG